MWLRACWGREVLLSSWGWISFRFIEPGFLKINICEFHIRPMKTWEHVCVPKVLLKGRKKGSAAAPLIRLFCFRHFPVYSSLILSASNLFLTLSLCKFIILTTVAFLTSQCYFLTFFVLERELQSEGSSIHWLTTPPPMSQMTTVFRAGQSESRTQEILLGLRGLRICYFLLLLSLAEHQGTGSEVEQLGFCRHPPEMLMTLAAPIPHLLVILQLDPFNFVFDHTYFLC